MKVQYCCNNVCPADRATWEGHREFKTEPSVCLANCSDCRTSAFVYADGVCLFGDSHADILQKLIGPVRSRTRS